MSFVRILIDADACPVKDEVYRVAFRRDVPVRVVSNSRIRAPEHRLAALSSRQVPRAHQSAGA